MGGILWPVTPGSRFGFLSRGLIIACLKLSWIWPVTIDSLIILNMGGPRIGRSSLRSLVGRGSRWQLVGFD